MSYFGAEFFGSRSAASVTGAATTVGSSSIYANVGETKNVTVTCNQTIESLSLSVVFETKGKTDVATVANGSITKSTTDATFTLPSDATASERVLRYSITRSDTDEQVASGYLIVSYDATTD